MTTDERINFDNNLDTYIELKLTRGIPGKIDKLFIYSLNSYYIIKYLKLRVNDIS
jgi:hypothetical protein